MMFGGSIRSWIIQYQLQITCLWTKVVRWIYFKVFATSGEEEEQALSPY